MTDLLNPKLRCRDIRKLVEPHLHEVKWDNGLDDTSPWVFASFEDEQHSSNFKLWLQSKDILGNPNVLLIGTGWLSFDNIDWSSVLEQPEKYFGGDSVLIVSSNKSWVLEYKPMQIIRFGKWE